MYIKLAILSLICVSCQKEQAYQVTYPENPSNQYKQQYNNQQQQQMQQQNQNNPMQNQNLQYSSQ